MLRADTPPQRIVERILQAARDWDFTTFVIGFERTAESRDPRIEPRLRQLKTEVGLELLRHWPERQVDFERPEVRLDVGSDLSVAVRSAPLFVAGRYRKLSRTIPASRWRHLACGGHGCEACGYTGNLCGPSLQEVFSGPLLARTEGSGTSFHGLGREDTDARMLGAGRPFVLEVQEPRRRRLELAPLVREANVLGRGRGEWLAPAVVERRTVQQVKEAAADKTYRAWIRFDVAPPPDAAARVESLAGRTVEQYSPRRVMHRRGKDNVRYKTVAESRWIGDVDGLIVWEVRAASGTYIKELISGDGGRTRPSLSGLLDVAARCVALDVLAVHWTAPWEKEPVAGRAEGIGTVVR